MEEIYFKDEYLCLYFDKSTRTTHAVWKGFLSGETLRLAVKQCLNLLAKEQPYHWLADNRKMKAIRQKDQIWIEQELVPKMLASPLRKMATLVSEDIFNQMAIENLYSKASGLMRFEHQYFKSEISAAQWLQESSPVIA